MSTGPGPTAPVADVDPTAASTLALTGVTVVVAIGMGRLFSGYNLITGAPRIRVTAENAERARELLTSGGVYGAT